MIKNPDAKMSDVYLATELYVENQMALTREQFKEQMDQLVDRHNAALIQQMNKIHEDNRNHTRWLVGLLITLIIAVLFRPLFP